MPAPRVPRWSPHTFFVFQDGLFRTNAIRSTDGVGLAACAAALPYAAASSVTARTAGIATTASDAAVAVAYTYA